ncbi:MAG: aldo/keto reductase [Oscillospiraceae bacterium]|nr:aldo/keto reductase [Oscillospiraceae bacterium]
MQYRIDPKTGNKLSALGFGCMRFPKGIAGQIDIDKSAALIKSAVDRGMNYFDTAYIYGGSEIALGQIFKRYPELREKIYIASKLHFHHVKSYSDLDRILNTQLERLGTDHIDYYLMHNLTAPSDWEGLCALGVESWIAEQKAAGRIRQIGFSYHGSQGDYAKLLECYSWEFTLIQYNYSDENYQAGKAGLQKAAAMGLPVMIMEPLLGGRLATGIPKQAVKLFEQAAPGRSPAAWAMRWLWDQPEVTVVLSGMNSMAQLDDNINTAENAIPGCLSASEREVYPQVVKIFRESYKIPCTGCNYCMPCPKRVNIPGCFAAYNASYAVDLFTGFQQYTTTSNISDPKSNSSARNCVKCGKCVKECPQNIDIPAQLKRVARRLEPAPMRWGARVHWKMHEMKFIGKYIKM